MKLFITGAAGQLGNEICRIIANKKSEIGDIDPRFFDAQIAAYDIDTLDISDQDAVMNAVLKEKPDVIINCAAMTNVDACENDPDSAFLINAVGVRNLAVAAEQVGAKFIHISTDYVFAGDGDHPYKEWDRTHPKSVYGASKALGEKYALVFCKKSFVVRTSWLYGYVGKNFVKTVRKVLREKGVITVVNDQRGNPTSANDLAHHLLLLALCEKYGIYHCTGEGECTWFDFATLIAQLSGYPDGSVKPCTSEEYKSHVKRPAYSSLDNMALRCSVGNSMRDWKIALEQYINNLED